MFGRIDSIDAAHGMHLDVDPAASTVVAAVHGIALAVRAGASGTVYRWAPYVLHLSIATFGECVLSVGPGAAARDGMVHFFLTGICDCGCR